MYKEIKTNQYLCLLTSASKKGWPSQLASKPQAKLLNGSTKSILNFCRKNQKLGREIIGFLSYDFGLKVQKIPPHAKNDLNLPESMLLAFDKTQKFNIQELKKITSIPHKSQNFKPTITRKQYEQAYKKIKSYIKEGDIYQINLTHRLQAKTNLPARNIFQRVALYNPVDYLAYIEAPDFQILSASPEKFISIKNGLITTTPVKGTRPRGKTEKEDQKFKTALLESEKEAAELNMITDLLRNDLGKVSKIGSVKVKGSRLLSKCPTVWHTYTEIQSQKLPGLSSMEVLISMMSGGSITGCPKKRAMEIIDELEKYQRSVYTGTIFHLKPNDDLISSIAIRTIIKKGQNLYLQVGGGIVNDSTEADEYQETLDKAKSFMQILEV